jgi:hypothetical protein
MSKQPKDKRGKFLPKTRMVDNDKKLDKLEEQFDKEEFIKMVKNDLYNLHLNKEDITVAYHLITGQQCGNIIAMRKTILGYSSN